MKQKSERIRQKEKLFKKLCNKVGKTIMEHKLIKENDHILVGISGGKDSYILLETLTNRKRILPFKFEISAAHVEVKNVDYRINKDYMQEYCKKLNVPLITKNIQLEKKETNKSMCFICSWNRRKNLFELTKEMRCNKLAFGHHRDDALQTFLMNMIYHGSISSLPYCLEMFEGRVQLIRPLLDLWEKDLAEYAFLSEIVKEEKICPWEENNKRTFAESLLKQIEKHYPKSPINMFHALDNIYPDYLPKVKSVRHGNSE